jgi:hypothetical protein
MARLSTQQLLAHIEQIQKGVETDDSLEGSLQFSARADGDWDVSACYRVGNLMGQGGTVLVRDESKDA